MNSYEGGLAQQSTTHFYGGAISTPKKQQLTKEKPKMACKKKPGTKPKPKK